MLYLKMKWAQHQVVSDQIVPNQVGPAKKLVGQDVVLDELVGRGAGLFFTPETSKGCI